MIKMANSSPKTDDDIDFLVDLFVPAKKPDILTVRAISEDDDLLLQELLDTVEYVGPIKDWRDVPETEESDDEPDYGLDERRLPPDADEIGLERSLTSDISSGVSDYLEEHPELLEWYDRTFGLGEDELRDALKVAAATGFVSEQSLVDTEENEDWLRIANRRSIPDLLRHLKGKHDQDKHGRKTSPEHVMAKPPPGSHYLSTDQIDVGDRVTYNPAKTSSRGKQLTSYEGTVVGAWKDPKDPDKVNIIKVKDQDGKTHFHSYKSLTYGGESGDAKGPASPRTAKKVKDIATDPPKPPQGPPPFPQNPKSTREIEEWASKAHPKTSWDLEGMDTEVAVGTVKQFDKLAGLYPEAAASIHYVGTGRNQSPAAAIVNAHHNSSGRNAYATHWNPQIPPGAADINGGMIGLNPAWFGNKQRFQVGLDHDVRAGYHPKGGNTPASVMTHEFGHRMQWWMERQGSTPMFPAARASGFGTVGSTTSSFVSANRRNRKSVSQYAMTNDKEGFAEGFLAMHHQPKSQWSTYTRRQATLVDAVMISPHRKSGKPVTWMDDYQGDKAKLFNEMTAFANKIGVNARDV